MIPFRKILFPVDFSKPCDFMAEQVKNMANHYAADVTLLHAFEAPSGYYGELGGLEMDLRELTTLAKQHLDRFAKQAFPDLKVEQRFDQANPIDAIRNFVHHDGTDLIMMPTSGYGPLRRLLLGSVTAKVLHDVSCAVWTDAHQPEMGHNPQFPYKSILCCVGWDEEAPALVHGAASLAKSFGAKLTVMHATELPTADGAAHISDYRRQLVQNTQAYLLDLRKEIDIDADVAVVEELITTHLREEVVRRKIDLIVLGRGNVQGWFTRLWSELYAVVRESPCPVISL